MRIAILDLGTNTFNLFISEMLNEKSFKDIHKSKISVKLGEGGITKNHIYPIPFERGIKAVKTFKGIIEKHGADKIIALGTSAIRCADNGKDFIQAIKEHTGITVEMISGEKEAELIYYGVKAGVAMNNSYSLIMDIGGGSTEFIISNNQEIIWKHSFLLGVARLHEKFNPADPITKEEVRCIEDYLEETLEPLFETIQSYKNEFTIHELIGSSGSFDSLAEMIAFRFHSPAILDRKTEYTFNMDEYSAIHQDILKSTTAERMQMKGLIRMRVDMIVISTLFIQFILKKLNITTMRLSRYSLKEGVLWEVMHSASK